MKTLTIALEEVEGKPKGINVFGNLGLLDAVQLLLHYYQEALKKQQMIKKPPKEKKDDTK